MRFLRATSFASALFVCRAPLAVAQVETAQTEAPGNVLLVVADDVGCDMIGSFGQRPDAPPTPTLDGLAANGVSFVSAYTDPICSPSRAGILTGRYAFRTGLGSPIATIGTDHSLAHGEITLPEALALANPWNVRNTAIGKWHLSAPPFPVALEPNIQGFQWFEGEVGNLYLPQSYYAHTKVRNGVLMPSTTYVTTEQVDDAIARSRAMREPWFMYVAFSSGHAPWHVPPANLHGYALSGAPSASPLDHYRASVQAMDTEFGRLLGGIDPAVLARTTVIFIGDNGSPNEVVTPPSVPGKCKGTLYEGGVHVPLIIAGNRVEQPGSRCYSLVNAVDLFPTVLDLLETPRAEVAATCRPFDGISLVRYLRQPWASPLREWVLAMRFAPNGFGPYQSYGRMVRSARWKLIERANQIDLFFDMATPQAETLNLAAGPMTLAQARGYRDAKDAIADLTSP
jgi:arylsulfatase A-like enzyme